MTRFRLSWRGTVTNMDHVVTFQAKTGAELSKAMAEPVECGPER
jgi:hypothetical protein